jgi:thymidylate synthase (FAD)
MTEEYRPMVVTLLAHTPYPDDVCDMAAATCVSREAPKGASEGHRSLRAALRSGHLSVCEHASFTFMVENVTRVTTHQLVRHRMASYEQQSQRYVALENIAFLQPDTVTDAVGKDLEAHSLMRVWGEATQRLADRLREDGVPEEDIRYLYPGGTVSNIMVTMNGRELLHFLALRRCSRAQWEIRYMADRMAVLAQEVAPVMFERCGPTCEQTGRCPEARSCGRLRS